MVIRRLADELTTFPTESGRANRAALHPVKKVWVCNRSAGVKSGVQRSKKDTDEIHFRKNLDKTLPQKDEIDPHKHII